MLHTFSKVFLKDASSSSTCLNINVTRDTAPWKNEACVRFSNSLQPPDSANITAAWCSLVKRNVTRRTACRASGSTGKLIRPIADLKKTPQILLSYVQYKVNDNIKSGSLYHLFLTLSKAEFFFKHSNFLMKYSRFIN